MANLETSITIPTSPSILDHFKSPKRSHSVNPETTTKRRRVEGNPPPTPASTPPASQFKYAPRPKPYSCSHSPCTATFSRPCHLKEHELNHTGERPYKCHEGDCDKTFTRRYHLTRHVDITHIGARDFTCKFDEKCGQRFATAQRRDEHEKTHNHDKKYTCDQWPDCNKVFHKKSTYLAHVALEHCGVKPYPCEKDDPKTGEKCTRGYNTAGKLKEHDNRVHSGPKYFCLECCPRGTVGFITHSAHVEHNRVFHAPQKKLRGRPKTKEINNYKIKIPKARKRANQHTARLEAENEMHPAGLLAPDSVTIACLRQTCEAIFSTEDSMTTHCEGVHGMAEVEIAEALRERAAIAGGVFWFGGVEPGTEYGQPRNDAQYALDWDTEMLVDVDPWLS